jgi:uncharacterized protein with HEPN domain
MAGRNTLMLLKDIRENIVSVAQLIEGLSYEEFHRDEWTYAAVIRCIRTIGGTAQRIPTIARVKYALVPWKELAALEDAVTHADPTTLPITVWKISTETLPVIRPLVENVIGEIER